MKVIITGATGLVGGGLVRACITNERITHAFILSRKPIAAELSAHEKITVILHDDFLNWPESLTGQLAGAEACLWAIGGKTANFPDVETAWKVGVDLTLAAAKAFDKDLAPKLPERKKFHFVFCSGMLAEWDQSKNLRFMKDTRLIKGKVEKGLFDIAEASKERFDVWSVRPGGILPANAGFLERTAGKLSMAIGVDRLATAMVKIALDGYKDHIIENSELFKI